MTLISLGVTKITLPDLILTDEKVGDNRVLRFAERKRLVEVDVYESSHDGWYELRTDLLSPYDTLYLHKHGGSRVFPSDSAFCLELCSACGIGDIGLSTRLKWSNHPAMGDSKIPNEIVYSWKGKFQFKQDDSENDEVGLRTPQLGALHAISGYFSAKQSEPATVVLPTGTGKTETMLATMVYRQLPKVLVLVPSNSLRDQISNKFYGLGCLTELGVVPIDVELPSVVAIKRGVKSVAEADLLLQKSNVFVATASVLESSDSGAIDRLCDGITDLFVDEAHHISATTWSRVRDRFSKKRVTQFTATPFRNNGSALGGRIIYNYTMGEAQEAGYFKHIQLMPVEEYHSDEEDESIARKAIEKLREDIRSGYDHLLMARVGSKVRAAELLPLYERLASDLHPVLVHSGMGKGAVNECLGRLVVRRSKIVICVDMLGEGFDLPNLKIAALHDIHKSLAVTLQFIGRFTRSTPSLGDASVVVNIADPGVEAGLERLYAQGADWDSVLRRLSEDRITREVRLQDIIEGLKEKGDLHHQLSLWNLHPSSSVVLFETSCDNWHPDRFESIIPKNTERWFSISEDQKLLVVLALSQSPVKWGQYKEIHDSVYKLLVVHWDQDRGALFVNSNDYKWFRIEKLVELITANQCALLSGPRVFNVFNGLQYPLVRNLGASQIGAISFTQYFGSNVTDGLSLIETSQSDLSNLAGLGYDDGERVIWGCSQKKGKIWAVSSGTIYEWLEWAKTAWDKVTTGAVDEANITRDFLRPEKLLCSYSEHAISVQWGEFIQSKLEERVTILFGEMDVPLHLSGLDIATEEGNGSYQISIICDDHEAVYRFTIDEGVGGGYCYTHLSGPVVSVKLGNGQAIPIEEYLVRDPWIIRYVDGSYSYNCYLIKIPETAGALSVDGIESWDWDGIDTRRESMGKERDRNTVQWRSFENIESQYDVIINDDGCGEAADLVGLKISGDEIHLGLVHCKYSGGDNPGARINDLYEVCGQAQKSIHWKHAGIPRLYSHLRRRDDIWRGQGDSRFLKGSVADLLTIKRRSRTAPVRLHVWVVQPGLDRSAVSIDMLRVLGSTTEYIKKTTGAELTIIGAN